MAQILLIEDDEVLNFVMMKFLQAYKVALKTDGKEALAWLREGHTPSLIISDVNMPNLSGIEFLEAKQKIETAKDIPVIILSGYHDAAKREQCLRLGATQFLSKPVEREDLLSLVSSFIK